MKDPLDKLTVTQQSLI